jgi:hypothetical protein
MQLEAMFHPPADEDESDNHRDRSEDMALHEKMLMWSQKLGADTIVENDTHFEGVEDEADELPELSPLPVYSRIILQSAAYEWFIASLKKEYTLQWTTAQPRVMVDDIRHMILNQLPTKRISKRTTPDAHTVTFDLYWNATIKNRLQCQFEESPGVVGSQHWLSKCIAVTGSLEEAQALTVEQYLGQTWPVNGRKLLETLRKTIEHRCSSSGEVVHLVWFSSASQEQSLTLTQAPFQTALKS